MAYIFQNLCNEDEAEVKPQVEYPIYEERESPIMCSSNDSYYEEEEEEEPIEKEPVKQKEIIKQEVKTPRRRYVMVQQPMRAVPTVETKRRRIVIKPNEIVVPQTEIEKAVHSYMRGNAKTQYRSQQPKETMKCRACGDYTKHIEWQPYRTSTGSQRLEGKCSICGRRSTKAFVPTSEEDKIEKIRMQMLKMGIDPRKICESLNPANPAIPDDGKEKET